MVTTWNHASRFAVTNFSIVKSTSCLFLFIYELLRHSLLCWQMPYSMTRLIYHLSIRQWRAFDEYFHIMRLQSVSYNILISRPSGIISSLSNFVAISRAQATPGIVLINSFISCPEIVTFLRLFLRQHDIIRLSAAHYYRHEAANRWASLYEIILYVISSASEAIARKYFQTDAAATYGASACTRYFYLEPMTNMPQSSKYFMRVVMKCRLNERNTISLRLDIHNHPISIIGMMMKSCILTHGIIRSTSISIAENRQRRST